MLRLPLALLAAALVASACADAPPNSGCTPETPCGDDIVAGVNLTRLLAEPTGGERDAVRARWAARTAAATGAGAPEVVLVTTATTPGGVEVRVLAGRDRTTGDTLFVAAVRRPRRDAGDTRRRPVLLVLPETPGTVIADDLPLQTGLAEALYDEVVMVGLAYRGQSVSVGVRQFGSEGADVPYVTDVDDAQTLLAAVGALEPLADASRRAAVGLGRGGTAALGLRARGTVPLAISFGAPTSWYVPSVSRGIRAALLGTAPVAPPDFPAVFAAAVQPLRDGQIALEEARLRLLERSPAPFLRPASTAATVVSVVAAHGQLDAVVDIDHTGPLLEVLANTGLVLQVDGATHTGVRAEAQVVSTVSAAVQDRLGIAP